MDTLTIDGKSIYDLKVTELKDELGKRSLSKTGNKQQLVNRLGEYLLENPEPAATPVPEKEKSPAKGDFVAQYLADREAQLAAALDHKRKVQAAEQKAEELQSTTEDTENTEMPVQTAEPPSRTASAPDEEIPEPRITSPSPTGRKTRQQSRSTPSRTELSPSSEDRENGTTKTTTVVRSLSPELSPQPLRSPVVKARELSPEVAAVPAKPEIVAGSSGTSPSLSISVADQGGYVGSDVERVSRQGETNDVVKVPHTVVQAHVEPVSSLPVSSPVDVAVDKGAVGGAVQPVDEPKKPLDEPKTAATKENVEEKVAKGSVEEKVPIAAGGGRKVFEKKKRPDIVPVSKEAENKEDKVEAAPPPIVTETVVKEEVKPKASEDKTVVSENVEGKTVPITRKLTESTSIEEEKLDYGDLEADDDVIMKDASASAPKPVQAEPSTNRKRRQSITAPTGRSDSISSKKSLSVKKSDAVTDENREIKEPPRKMARSGLGSVSDENKNAGAGEQTEKRSSPPPSKIGSTRMLHIKNLVRPFTVGALKEMLKKTGTIVDDAEHFWMDSIKSQCIVCYSTDEEANATRNALYGTKWPASSTKELNVDFIKEEEFKEKTTAPAPSTTPTTLEPRRSLTTPRPHTQSSLDPKALENLKVIVASNKDTGEMHRDVALTRDLERRAERRVKEKEAETAAAAKEELQRNNVVKKEEPVVEKTETVKEREWDRGKEKEAEVKKEASKPEERAKSPPEKNRLELLFERTETKPQLYWKRLTDAEITAREEKRRLGIFDERRPREIEDIRAKAPERLRESPDRRLPRRESSPGPLRRSRSRDRGYRGARGGGGGGGGGGGFNNSFRRRPSPRRSPPPPSYGRRRSRSPPRFRGGAGGGGGGGRRSRSPRGRRW